MSSTWKQAVFLGGAIFVLAACSDATGPESRGPAVTSAHAMASQQASQRPKRKSDSGPVTQTTQCRSGYSVSVGVVDTVGVTTLCVF